MKIRWIAGWLALVLATVAWGGDASGPRNVVLISCDGMGRDVLTELLEAGKLPAFAALRREGSLRAIEVVGHATSTRPSHATMLTGVAAKVHGVGGPVIAPMPAGLSVFERLEQHFGRDGIHTLMVAGKAKNLGGALTNDIYYAARQHFDWFESKDRLAAEVWAAAKPVLAQRTAPRFFLFLHFADPDYAGHTFGKDSREYREAMVACDGVVGALVAWLKAQQLYDSTRVYITADHGFDDHASQHGNAPHIFLLTNDGAVNRDGVLADVPATILARFGVNVAGLQPPLAGKPLLDAPAPGDATWEYRPPGGAWTTNAPATVAWPRGWRTFTRWEYGAGKPPHDDDPAAFTNVPTAMTLNGISACRASLPNYGPGILDLTVGQGAPRTGLWAYVFGEVKADQDQEVVLHTAASGPTQFWFDGQPVTTAPLRIAKGSHVLAGKVASGAQEWNLAGCFLPVGFESRRVPAPPAKVNLPATVGWPAAALAHRQSVTIGLVGDPQSGAPWRDIAPALAEAKPDALVIIGDLVANGLSADGWNQTFFAPAANLLGKVPWLAVLGNHDRRSPLFEQFGGLKWAREAGPALVVGIDGGLDWSPGSEHAQWLEQTLAATPHRWKFVISHYPAYSSRNHGKLADDGLVLERSSRIARTQLVPLLEKHKVTALFCGHDHGYERSELPSGLTTLTVAGGGAGLYPKRDDDRANPFSKVLVDKHHYGLLRIAGNEAVFTALTADGATLDTRTWPAK